MNDSSRSAWYRQPIMWLITGLLSVTVVSGVVTITIAASGDDTLVVSEQQYQQLKSELRASDISQDADDG